MSAADAGEVIAPLTAEELATLVTSEAAIERGLASFVEVGTALAGIRDSRLYRESYSTFEDYCRDRWEFSRAYVHRLIESSIVVELLPIGNKPHNEAQARELAPLKSEPEKMALAMERAAERTGGQVTAEAIAKEVQELRPTAAQIDRPDHAKPRLHRIDGAKTVRRIVDVVSTIPHIVDTIPADTRFDASEVAAWSSDLTNAIRSLSALRKRLENQ